VPDIVEGGLDEARRLLGALASAVAWVQVREAARLLGVSTGTVHRLCAEGGLPHARIPNAIRIVPADLAEFVMTRRRTP
jgi:excisionase family DNA binding protein